MRRGRDLSLGRRAVPRQVLPLMRLGKLDCADRATLVEALAGGKTGVVVDVGTRPGGSL